MVITKEFLENKKACAEGIAAFCAAFPIGFDLSEWTREKQIEVIKSDLRIYSGWAFSAGIIPLWSMDGASLNRANLNRASLNRASLNRASLNRANLNRANLNRANLDGANLDGANLYGANLDGANLDGANLYGAKYSKKTKFPEGFDPKAAGAWLIE